MSYEPPFSAAVDYLLDAFQAAVLALDDGAAVLVCEGQPGNLPKDVVCVAETLSGSTSVHAMAGAAPHLLAEFRVSVEVTACVGGSAPFTRSRLRGKELMHACTAAVASDPSLGGTVLSAWPEVAPDASNTWTEDHKFGMWDGRFSVVCAAYVT